MKTHIGSCSVWFLAFAVLLLDFAAVRCYSQGNQPVITAIHPDLSNVVVEVSLPAGFQRVTLEARPRVGGGAWSPVAVGQNDGTAKTLKFRVACSRQSELLRVRADNRQPLPAAFYNGTNRFSGPMDSSTAAGGAPTGGVVVSGGATPASGDATRTVVESDIWQIDGDRLYFFNQYRGLQVIDIASPDTAKILGTLDLPAAGEQMYLADSTHVVLLANGPCTAGTTESQAIIVDVSNGNPRVVTNLLVGGWLQDSRMVGTALYLAAQNYRPVSGTTNSTWEWGTEITSFDLANPGKPVRRNTLWYSGFGNVVSSTDTYLFVITQDATNWWQSVVQIIDVTSPDGVISPSSSLRTSGRIEDKFKLNYTNGVLTSISEDWRNRSVGPITRLETFHLPDPRSMGPGGISKLGELEVGSGERLHATRFDGNLVYVVTFFQIDPLWVVDLSNPAKPHIAGSVNVPGWSSYIVPLGDRLVTVGVESNRVAVSLFDVQDPAKPASLSHLVLGQNYSWSDANYDEKAFTVLAGQGLVLVPYNGDTTNGWTSQVQLIDLTRTNLVARGLIHHQFQPRRTAFAQNRVLSLSGWELLSVDVSNRDHPEVKGDTQLAWPVDRLFFQGDYLLELTGSSGWWGYQAPTSVRVSPLHQHDNVLATVALTDQPIVGACLKDGLLYVAQSPVYWYLIPLDGPGGVGDSTNLSNFSLTILDARHLPDLPVLGQTSIAADISSWGGTWNAVWPSSNVIVWSGGGSYFGWATPGAIIKNAPIGVGGAIYPWWGSPGGQLLAFDVGKPSAPVFDSEVNLATNGWSSFSQPFASGPRVYLSHAQFEVQTNTGNPDGIWVELNQLDVIDYADPVAPTLRSPVSIPGTLQGLSHEGELLYTLGLHWAAKNVPDWTQWLEASAYDGLTAHLVGSLALPASWPHPVLLVDTNIFIGNPGSYGSPTNVSAPQLQTWSLAASGTFTLNGSIDLSQPIYTLGEFNGLIAGQDTDNSLELFDDSAPASLSRVAYAPPSGCLWYDLTHAAGAVGKGFWLPLGLYGVREITLSP